MGASAIVLLASMFGLDWYGLTGALAPTAARLGLATTVTGWDGLAHLRWLILLTGVTGLALVYFQATRRAPAVPASLSVIVTVLSVLTSITLLYRVLINPPGANNLVSQKPGAFVGLVSAIALAYGGYRSMRQEGLAARDAPAEIETVRLRGDGRASARH